MMKVPRDKRRHLRRAAWGALWLVFVAVGGFTSTPSWLSDVADVLLFLTGLWLVFTAGMRFASADAAGAPLASRESPAEVTQDSSSGSHQL